MATYLGRPVEVIEDYGNGITRIKFLDVSRAYLARLTGESDAEHAARLAAGLGTWDVASDRVED